MAIWNSTGDQKQVEMMKLCNVLPATEIIKTFEETGDPVHLDKFLEAMRRHGGIYRPEFRARQSCTL